MENKIILPFSLRRPILALGSHTKNILAFAKGDTAFFSRVHLNLDNWQDFLDFQKDLKCFLKKRPEVIACDLHPFYRSTQVAEGLSKRYTVKKIQHHHAHITSCMLENNLKNQKVIGVAFDGTGLGTDGHLWGAEFLLSDYEGFERLAHLRYIALPSAEMAIRQPWRIAFSWLYSIYREEIFKLDIEFSRRLNYRNSQILKQMLDTGFNSPFSSSMGRLFDAVGTLVLNKFISGYEGQFPIEMENLAKKFRGPFSLDLKDYVFKIKKENNIYIIEPFVLFKEIIKDLKNRRPKAEISFKFHLAVSLMVKDVCMLLRRKTGINKIVLSGGVFQNSILKTLISDLLYKNKFMVFSHVQIPCSDVGISLGQIAIANFL